MQNTKSISKRGLSFDLSPPSLAYEPLPTTDSSSATLNDPSQGQERDPSSRDWKVLVALCTFSVALCYADRSNISTGTKYQTILDDHTPLNAFSSPCSDDRNGL